MAIESRNSRHFGTGTLGTCVRHFSTKTNRPPDNLAPQLDKSAPQKDKSALFNHVCSGKDPDHADNTVTLYTTVV